MLYRIYVCRWDTVQSEEGFNMGIYDPSPFWEFGQGKVPEPMNPSCFVCCCIRELDLSEPGLGSPLCCWSSMTGRAEMKASCR